VSTPSVRHWRAGLVGALALATVLPLTSFQGASAGPPGRWTTLSIGHEDSVRQPSIHRFGADAQVIWTQPTAVGSALWTRILNRHGNPTSAPIRILNWAGLIEDPVIFGIGSERVIAFSGLRNGNSLDPYTNGAEYSLTSTNGTAWTLRKGSLSASQAAYGSYGTAAINHNGEPLVAFTEASASRITFHNGFDSASPAGTPDGHTADTGNFAYDTGLGEDARTSQVWAVWYSNSGKASTDAVNAQRIFPSMSARVHAPKSTATISGWQTSTAPDQDLPVVARPASVGGGVYTAYATPKDRSIVLWRVGSPHVTLTITSKNGIGQVSMASGGRGRLWIFWRDGLTGHMQATRTNIAATRIGAIRSVAPPSGTTVYRSAGDGTPGTLDLVTLVQGTRNAMISTQVLPGLSMSTRHAWRRGHTYTVKVTDAGAPVAGASVHFAGRTARANRHGVAHLRVPSVESLGRHLLSAGRAGYAAARLKVTVKR
jgi:hypothetical protein